jgi:hypothetical protein
MSDWFYKDHTGSRQVAFHKKRGGKEESQNETKKCGSFSAVERLTIGAKDICNTFVTVHQE